MKRKRAKINYSSCKKCQNKFRFSKNDDFCLKLPIHQVSEPIGALEKLIFAWSCWN